MTYNISGNSHKKALSEAKHVATILGLTTIVVQGFSTPKIYVQVSFWKLVLFYFFYQTGKHAGSSTNWVGSVIPNNCSGKVKVIWSAPQVKAWPQSAFDFKIQSLPDSLQHWSLGQRAPGVFSEHVVPSPLYPALQVQLNEPSEFSQEALRSQFERVGSPHSSISVQAT